MKTLGTAKLNMIPNQTAKLEAKIHKKFSRWAAIKAIKAEEKVKKLKFELKYIRQSLEHVRVKRRVRKTKKTKIMGKSKGFSEIGKIFKDVGLLQAISEFGLKKCRELGSTIEIVTKKKNSIDVWNHLKEAYPSFEWNLKQRKTRTMPKAPINKSHATATTRTRAQASVLSQRRDGYRVGTKILVNSNH